MARVKRSRRTTLRSRRRKVGSTSYIRRRGRVGATLRRKYNSAPLFKRYRNPFTAASTTTMLQYSQNILLNPQADNLGAGGANAWIFSVNSLFDPDTTGTGHQPMYYDNYAQLYNRYKVNYAQITVTCINHQVNTDTAYQPLTGAPVLNVNENYAYKLAIVVDRDLTDYPTTMNRLIEEGGPNIKWRFVAPSLNGKLPKLFHSASPSRLTGLSFGDDTLQADIGASPSRQCYFAVLITSADGTTDPPNVYCNVRIKYYVKFFDRRTTQVEN